MLSQVLFLRALLAHVDRLQPMLGEEWPDLQERLQVLLNEILSEPSECALPAHVNRIYRCFAETPGEAIVRALFRQASELARQLPPGTRIITITDPTTGESRSADLWVPDLPLDALDQGLATSAEEFAWDVRELLNLHLTFRKKRSPSPIYGGVRRAGWLRNFAERTRPSPISVYVSYAWQEEEQNRLVDKLGEACAARGIELLRDKISIGYGDSIRRFMDEIGAGGHVVLVLSEAYFKSEYCMYELRRIQENRDFRKRVYPIVLSGTRFHKPIDRIPYIKYWENETANLQAALGRLRDPINILELQKALNGYADFRRLMSELQSDLADMNTLTEEDHLGTDFAALLDRTALSGPGDLAAGRDLTRGRPAAALPSVQPHRALAATVEELAATARELVQVLASTTKATKTAERHATPPETPMREVYPDIAVDEAHPVRGCPVNFTVTLATHKSADTTGRVLLPDSAQDVEHTLQVHLLFAGRSAWDSLMYSAARGTIKAASLSLPAPPISGEHELIEARANFYLNQRWCGEGQRHLDVRRDATVAPLAAIPPPPVPPWRRALLLQPAALPPDLIVRIQKGVMPGEFLWSCLSPHLDLPPSADARRARMSLGEDAATFVRRTFAPLAGKTLDRLSTADVCGAGEKIYRSTPPYFRDCYWAVWQAAVAGGFRFESVQIITDEPCVPWELMRLRDPERAPGVDAEFLGIRHSVGRWLASESAAMRQSITVRKVAVTASDYQNVAAVGGKLPWAASERELMVGTYHAESVPLRSDAVLDFLEGGRVQAVHFACHGRMSVSDPDASLLVMEDTPNDLKPLAVARSEVCDGLGSEHPLVFLNACEVGGAAASLSLIAGFPAAFLYAGAAALVSPLWAVNDEHARAIAEDFYKEVFLAPGGKTMGEVLRDLRQRWQDEKHLTFLAYVLYGDPLARVEYHPGP